MSQKIILNDFDNIANRFEQIVPISYRKKLQKPRYFHPIPKLDTNIESLFIDEPEGFFARILHKIKYVEINFFRYHHRDQIETEVAKWLYSQFNLLKNRHHSDWKWLYTFCTLFSQVTRFSKRGRDYAILQTTDFETKKCLVFKTKKEYQESKYYYNEDFAFRGTKGNLIPVIWIGKGWDQTVKKYQFAPGVNCEVQSAGILDPYHYAIHRKFGKKHPIETKEELESWYSTLEWD